MVRSLRDLANAESAPVLTLSPFFFPRPQEMEYRVELFNKCVSRHRPSLIARLGVAPCPSLPPCRRSDRNADRPNFALTRDARKPHRLCPSPRRMVSSCHEKCIDKKYKDGDLNVGENSCVDRCTSKYWQCVGIVGQMLGAADAAAAQGGR